MFFKNPKWIALLIDALICSVTLWFSFYLRLGEFISILDLPYIPFIASIIILFSTFKTFSIYESINRYSGWKTFIQISKALLVYDIIFFIIFTLIGYSDVPRTIGLIQPILVSILVFLSRAMVRFVLGGNLKAIFNKSTKNNVLIYGAGIAGRQLAAALSIKNDYNIIGFIDDNLKLVGQRLNNIKIYSLNEIKKKHIQFEIKSILVAIPSLSQTQKKELFNSLQIFNISVKILPDVSEITKGKVDESNLRNLNIYDLLGRKSMMPNYKKTMSSITSQIILVTGGGGSIGSELCFQIINLKPKTLVIMDINEFGL